jgi:hypothetical protein
MKSKATQRFVSGFILLLLGILPLDLIAEEGGTVRLDVILVEAGTGDAGVDPALRAYGTTLKRLFRFGQYRQVSQASVRLSAGASGEARFPGGQQVSLLRQSTAGSGVRVQLRWVKNRTRLLETALTLKGGTPAVLGGPRGEAGSTYILIVRRR